MGQRVGFVSGDRTSSTDSVDGSTPDGVNPPPQEQFRRNETSHLRLNALSTLLTTLNYKLCPFSPFSLQVRLAVSSSLVLKRSPLTSLSERPTPEITGAQVILWLETSCSLG